jgi:hypothetical protein
MKKRVKFLTSIAGLADPDQQALDRKYERFTERKKLDAEKAGREFKPGPVKSAIVEFKKVDRYHDVSRGFERDFHFKTGDEGLIPADVAAKWEKAGICLILGDRA